MHLVRTVVSVAVLGTVLAAGSPRDPATLVPAGPRAQLATLPISFEANEGQAAPGTLFLARSGACTTFLTRDGAVFSRAGAALRMRAVGGDPAPRIAGSRELPGKVNSYVGNDPSRWRTGIRTFASVAYRDLYPGIDLVFHGDQSRMEYDFVVAPGADPRAIALSFDGADRLEIAADGALVVGTADWTMSQRPPVVYQDDTDGSRREIGGRYALHGDVVAFEVADYDAARALVIDPVLVYSTLLGGSGGDGTASIAVDAAGRLHGTSTYGPGDMLTLPEFPTRHAIKTATEPGTADVVIFELNPRGTALLYSTYFGGSAGEGDPRIAVDASGNSYVVGTTGSPDLPVTAGVYQSSPVGGAAMFVAKLDAAGALTWCTYVQGGDSVPNGIAVDGPGNAYVTGYTGTGNGPAFSATTGAFQTSANHLDAFVFKLHADASTLDYATFFGGSGGDKGNSIAVDATGHAFVAGDTDSTNLPTKNAGQAANGGDGDAFIAEFDPTGASLVYATYLGGGGFTTESGVGIAVDSLGRTYVTGQGSATSFPFVNAMPGSQPGMFVARVPAGGGAFDFLTGLPVTPLTSGVNGLALDAAGDVYICGNTTAGDLPAPCPPLDHARGGRDAFVLKIKGDGSAIVYAAYLGGGDFDYATSIAVSAAGEAYVGGITRSVDYGPLVRPVQSWKSGDQDLFLVKLGAEDRTGPGGCAAAIPTDAFLVPKAVAVKLDATTPAKSTLVASGTFDTGSATANPNFTAPATIAVGGVALDVPGLVAAKSGKSFSYSGQGLAFSLAANKAGSSKASFKLKYTGDFRGRVDPAKSVVVTFDNGTVAAACVARLTAGKFAASKVRGALSLPNLYVSKLAAKLLGGGKDSVTLVAGLATSGSTPGIAPDFAVGIGPVVPVDIPSGSFTRIGDRFVFAGNVDGITSVVLDYKKETVTVKGSNLDLGSFASPAAPVTVSVRVGTDRRAVTVTAVRKATSLSY